MSDVTIRRVEGNEDGVVSGLAEVLVDCVVGGASVGFMDGFDRPQAEAFWATALASSRRGERILLVAEDPDAGAILGTVQVVLAVPDNQPHRGEITKMLVHRRARRRGVGEALMSAAEAAARQAGKTLLVLDTASPDAERLYHRLGWHEVGRIPDYALWPDGRPVDTLIFYKMLS